MNRGSRIGFGLRFSRPPQVCCLLPCRRCCSHCRQVEYAILAIDHANKLVRISTTASSVLEDLQTRYVYTLSSGRVALRHVPNLGEINCVDGT